MSNSFFGPLNYTRCVNCRLFIGPYHVVFHTRSGLLCKHCAVQHGIASRSPQPPDSTVQDSVPVHAGNSQQTTPTNGKSVTEQIVNVPSAPQQPDCLKPTTLKPNLGNQQPVAQGSPTVPCPARPAEKRRIAKLSAEADSGMEAAQDSQDQPAKRLKVRLETSPFDESEKEQQESLEHSQEKPSVDKKLDPLASSFAASERLNEFSSNTFALPPCPPVTPTASASPTLISASELGEKSPSSNVVLDPHTLELKLSKVFEGAIENATALKKVELGAADMGGSDEKEAKDIESFGKDTGKGKDKDKEREE